LHWGLSKLRWGLDMRLPPQYDDTVDIVGPFMRLIRVVRVPRTCRGWICSLPCWRYV
jgi:hypothetical protein